MLNLLVVFFLASVFAGYLMGWLVRDNWWKKEIARITALANTPPIHFDRADEGGSLEENR